MIWQRALKSLATAIGTVLPLAPVSYAAHTKNKASARSRGAHEMNERLLSESRASEKLDHFMNRLVGALLIAAITALMVLQAHPPQ
jgi:hypothetical protein